MLNKTEQIIATFHNIYDAMKTEELCKEQHITGRIIPVPADISAGCGLCFLMPLKELSHFMRSIADAVDPAGYFKRYR